MNCVAVLYPLRFLICCACLFELAPALLHAQAEHRIEPVSVEFTEGEATVDATWIKVESNDGLSWNPSGLSDLRWYRLHFQVSESFAQSGKLAFSPGVVSSVFEVYLDGKKFGHKGNFEPQTGFWWSGRFEVFELPRPIVPGQRVVIEMRIRSYSSTAGMLGERPQIDLLSELTIEQSRRNWSPALMLVALIVALATMLFFAVVFSCRMWREWSGWAFAIVVLAELSELFTRASVLFDWPTTAQVWISGAATFLWGFVAYPCWLVVILRLDREKISRPVLLFAAISAILGLVVGAIGFRDSTASIFAWILSLAFLIGFAWGWFLVLRLLRRKYRHRWAVLIFWSAGHAGLLVDILNALSPGTVSEIDWWISPLNLSFLIPALGFAWLILQGLLDDRKLTAMLADRVVTVQEDERRMLARELHDGAAQNLQALKLQLQLGDDASISTDERTEIIRWLEMTATEIRQTARHMHPSVLEEKTLVEAIRDYASNLSRTGLEIRFGSDPDIKFSRLVAGNLYRIFQEAVANSIHHGKASRIQVTLRWHAAHEAVELVVRDDGVGLQSSSGGLGMQSIEERAALCHGSAQWRSDGGTILRVRLHPLFPT